MLRPWMVMAVFAACFLAGCAPSEEEVSFDARRKFLTRQNQGIRELIEEQEKGSLVPTGRFLVGVSEHIAADLLRSQLPFERPLGKRFVVRIDSATVLLRDKFGVITMDGEIHRHATPDRKTAVRIHGGLGAVAIDPVTDVLRVQIAIDDIELLQAGILENVLGRGGKKFLAQKGQALLQDALPQLTVPVRLGRAIHIPAITEGALQLDSLEVPLDLSVERVIAAKGMLWATLNAEVGKVRGAEEGLGVAVKKKKKPSTAGPK